MPRLYVLAIQDEDDGDINIAVTKLKEKICQEVNYISIDKIA